MAKRIDDSVYDAFLNVIKNNVTTAVFCSADPVNYAGIAAVALVTKGSLTSANFTGPANGDTSGRKLTFNATTANTPSANGTVVYAAFHDGTTLLAGTTVTSQAVTTSQQWDTPAIDIVEIADPT